MKYRHWLLIKGGKCREVFITPDAEHWEVMAKYPWIEEALHFLNGEEILRPIVENVENNLWRARIRQQALDRGPGPIGWMITGYPKKKGKSIRQVIDSSED